VFDNTIGSADITNDSLSSIDIASGGVSSAEIAPFSINEGDIASNVIDSRHINNGTLNDEDVGQGTVVDFAASIGTIPPESCVYRNVTGINAQGDHLLLTPSFHDSQDAVYSLQYHTDAEHATLQACNPGPFSVNDGITHFNLLVIDAQ
jgi:hypothetical protein